MGIRAHLIGALMASTLSILCMVLRSSITPAFAGIAINYSLVVTNLMMWGVLITVRTEAQVGEAELPWANRFACCCADSCGVTRGV